LFALCFSRVFAVYVPLFLSGKNESSLYCCSPSAFWFIEMNGPNDIAKGTQVNVTDGANNTGTWEVDTDNPIIVAETSIVLSMVAATVGELNASISIAAASASSAAISAGESAASFALTEAAGAEALGDIATAESSALGDIATAESSALVNLGVAEAEGIIAITTSSDQAAIATAQAEDSALSASAASASAADASASAGNVSVFVNSPDGAPVVNGVPLTVTPAIIQGVWTSVGPTGSGADIIWQPLNLVPSNTDWLEIKTYLNVFASNAGIGRTAAINVHTRKTGSIFGLFATNSVAVMSDRVGGDIISNRSTQSSSMSTAKIQISNSRMFDIHWVSAYDDSDVFVFLVGYGANS